MIKYLNKNVIFNNLIKESPASNLNIIVIIPAYNEPNIIETIESLNKCTKPKLGCEVIILFNDSETTPQEITNTNTQTNKVISKWKNKNETFFTLHTIHLSNLNKKHAGAGLARKIAMDEACYRFHKVNNNNGIIMSLDADCIVSNNYFTETEKVFSNTKTTNCAIFSFRHRIDNELTEHNIEAIKKYELHLRYFRLALRYCGFPYSLHTIGSCFAVTAHAYTSQGGMNRKQGGEDFYFLHKMFPLEKYTELYNIYVYPSARPSNRVPFGTGPTIRKIINEGAYYTYNIYAFEILKSFFSSKSSLYKANKEYISGYYKTIATELQLHITENDFAKNINEINNNCASIEAFNKRFFQWFNAFKIIKFLNHTHTLSLDKPSIEFAANSFLEKFTKNETIKSLTQLLDEFIQLDENSFNSHRQQQ